MKKNTNRWIFAIMVSVICLVKPASGQLVPMDFVYGGIADTEKILALYLEPYANILGSDLNAGWYNTARPHELGGLDVTFSASWAKAPSSLLTYDAASLGLTGQIVPGSSTIAPTIAGDLADRPSLSYTQQVEFPDGSSQEIEYARYTLPNGTGIDFFPLPMAQLTVGLPFGTDVSARFIPMIQLGDYGEIGLWGVGGKHSVSQWIPGLKDLELLDISVQGGYSKVSSRAHVVVVPLTDFVEVDPNPGFDDWDDQFVVQNVSGWTLNLIASQTISVLTIYEGIGYASSFVEMALQGHFPIHTVITEPGDDLGKTTYFTVNDPFSLDFENINNLRLNVGARIKLGVFTMHYDFTYTLYATHSVGLGISFK
jgi:hypothetical protein